MRTFLIAIVGRPNVGKSRMFNRLGEDAQAIVHDYEGVTRDRQYAEGEWYGKRYTLIDTGGFIVDTQEPMLVSMRRQAQLAIEEADLILFLMDGRAGVTPGDRDIANLLRQGNKPVFYVANKVDAQSQTDALLADFYQLGEEVWPASAEHGTGLDNLMDAVALQIPAPASDQEALPEYARIAVVGKPNAGKSSLINRLIGKDRLLTSEVAGTTRDAVDMKITREGKEYLLVDTAGLRRKKSISEELEQFAVVQALRSLDRTDVALLVIDATEGITSQDKKIASVITNRGRACLIVINKWDLIEKDSKTVDLWRRELREEMPYMSWAPILFLSALTGQRVHTIFEHIDYIFERYTKRITTGSLNKFLERALALHSPPVAQNKRLKFYYASQVAVRSPAFVFMVNYPQQIPTSYKRFLENRLREEFDFEGTPLRMLFRERRRRDLSAQD